MPSRLSSPMLSLDINHIAKVDPRNVDNLFSMWTSKSHYPLENLIGCLLTLFSSLLKVC